MSSMTKSDEEHAAPVTITHSTYIGDRIGNPAPLAMGGFATTLMSVSMAMMKFRGVTSQVIFVGDLCFVACFALLISAQWAMVKGDTFSYTVLSAYGLFYGGYGAIMIPSFGIAEAFGGYTPMYYNSLGFFVLFWAAINLLFLVASVRFNLVYIGIFFTLEFALVLEASSFFVYAEGREDTYYSLMKAAGAFAFIASALGYYTMAHYFCQDVVPFRIPMGDTACWFRSKDGLKEKQ